ncbi:monocarboxylate transporter 12 isoform X1 [Thrips palmi]|uniref:Monocarboxylate transporter 12 isoform X1 n=1 Tax=Thrips palmi TaxID=161013 RepID=A0A6P8YU83_THRPL|nr:monocarboxylate transporter 12 isoform X1 [Thrips palmi]XP_034237652.1 monocarboxylate transporter 12 isoform X1 [Thrips palmi]
MTHAPAARKKPGAEDDESETDSTAVPPPDGGWGWFVVWASFMIHIVTDGVTYSFGQLLPPLANYFDVGLGATSLIMSILVGVTLCSGPIASAFVNKWGCRTVTIAGALLSGVCLAVSFFATNVATLCVTIGLGAGFGFGLIYLPAIVSVTCYFEKYRSLATGIAVAGSGLGTFIFAPFIGYLLREYGGWRGAMLILAGLVFNTAIMGALFRPLEKPRKRRDTELQELHKDKAELKMLLNGDVAKENQSSNQLMPPAQTVMRSAHNISTAGQDQSGDHNTVPRNMKVLSLNLSATPHQILTAGQNHHNHHNHNHNHHHNHSWRHKSDIARLALSQPTLQTTTGSVQHLAGSGVMYRKDVFYRGSLVNIPHYSPRSERGGSPTASEASTLRISSLAVKSPLSSRSRSRPLSAPQSPEWRYSLGSRPRSLHALHSLRGLHGSANMAFADVGYLKDGAEVEGEEEAVAAAAVRAVETSASKLSRHTSAEGLGLSKCPSEMESPDSEAQLTVCGCIPCSPETKDTLTEMLDMSLFKDVIFILFTVSNFLTSIGFYMPYAYLGAYAEETLKLSSWEASQLVAIIGIANTIGRLVLGYISDKPWVNRLLIYNLALTIAGVATCLVVVCEDFWTLAVYAAVFGFTIGAYVGLTSVILVDLLGLDRLTNAFGLLLLFQGLASFAGPPIGGKLKDDTNSYKPSFWVAGVAMALSGLMLFVVPPIQRMQAEKRRKAQIVSSPTNGNSRPQAV